MDSGLGARGAAGEALIRHNERVEVDDADRAEEIGTRALVAILGVKDARQLHRNSLNNFGVQTLTCLF